MLALGFCVAVLAGLEGSALAAGPGPEPAPPAPPPALHPDPAPSAQPTPSGSSSSTSTPQSSFPATVTPSTQAVAPPPPAAFPPAATTRKQTRRIVSTSNRRPHKGSAVNRAVRFPGLIFARTPFRAIGGQVADASTSRESRLLLAGGFALVLLVIGETTFLALAGARLGFGPGRLPRHRKPA
jgi:hypothetical protein